MIAVILFGILLAMGLVILLARFAPNPRAIDLEQRESDHRPRLGATQLRALSIDLLQALGLTVVEEEMLGDERRLIAAQAAEPELAHTRYVVFVEPSPPGDVVTQSTVVELSDYVKGERAATGMLITPYVIDRAGLAGLEVPIELIDGARLAELVQRYLPGRIEELRRYRGLGPVPVTAPPAPAYT
jgi:hypothetical protein